MKKSYLLSTVCTGIISLISIPSHAALIDNGGGLIYDNVLKITWAQPDAGRTWDDANTWASGLTLGGVSGWRLPFNSVAAGAGPTTDTGDPVDCITASERDCRDNELGYMFYHNLGGTRTQSILTSGDPDLALFPTLQPYSYWTGTVYDDEFIWNFDFGVGENWIDFPNDGAKSWAVHAGNVGAVVPLPAAVWLFGSGLIGVIGLARRKT